MTSYCYWVDRENLQHIVQSPTLYHEPDPSMYRYVTMTTQAPIRSDFNMNEVESNAPHHPLTEAQAQCGCDQRLSSYGWSRTHHTIRWQKHKPNVVVTNDCHLMGGVERTTPWVVVTNDCHLMGGVERTTPWVVVTNDCHLMGGCDQWLSSYGWLWPMTVILWVVVTNDCHLMGGCDQWLSSYGWLPCRSANNLLLLAGNIRYENETFPGGVIVVSITESGRVQTTRPLDSWEWLLEVAESLLEFIGSQTQSHLQNPAGCPVIRREVTTTF
jgi:hypothetical protein